MDLARELAASGTSPGRKAPPCLVAISLSTRLTPPPLPLVPLVCAMSQPHQNASFGHSSPVASSEFHSDVSIASAASSQTSLRHRFALSLKLTVVTTHSATPLTHPAVPNFSVSGGGYSAFQLT